jgi:glutathione S-transferase
MALKVFGHPMSTCTRKLLTVLHEKGAAFDFVLVDLTKGEHKQPAHLARQPFGQVPAIDDDGFSLFESRAICRYLDAKLPGASLTPKDLKAQAVMEQWISVETSNFTPHAMKIIYQRLFNKLAGKEPIQSIVDEGLAGVDRTAEIMDKHLANNQFMAGSAYSLADISFSPYIEYLTACEALEPITKRANTNRWWNEISNRAAWKKAAGR